MNLEVTLAGKTFKNPVTTASGTFGSGAEYEQFVDLAALGAVTTKGVANVPWEGNPTPRVAETYGGMLNAVGLQNPGIDLFCKRDIPHLKEKGDSDSDKPFLFSHHYPAFLYSVLTDRAVLLPLSKNRPLSFEHCIPPKKEQM